MSQKEIKEFREILKKKLEEVSNSKEAAKEVLIRAGILTPKGKLRKEYKFLK